MPADDLTSSASRVQAALRRLGVEADVVEVPSSTRTAKQAADAIGCREEQIAKSILFRQRESGAPVLVVASGPNRISETLVGSVIGQRVVKADADYVRSVTGFAIGGVPPFGHERPIPTLLDEDLFELDAVWAAAGTPRAVMRLTPGQLIRGSGGEVVRIAEHRKRSPDENA